MRLEDIIEVLKGMPRERVLGDGSAGHPDHCAKCALATVLRDTTGKPYSVGYSKVHYYEGSRLTVDREQTADERLIRRAFDEILADRDAWTITVGDFLDELRYQAEATDNVRLLGLLGTV